MYFSTHLLHPIRLRIMLISSPYASHPMLCIALQCYAMQCNAILCYAMQCNVMLYYAMQCYVIQCYAMICNAMQCNAILCYAMLWCLSSPVHLFRLHSILFILFYSLLSFPPLRFTPHNSTCSTGLHCNGLFSWVTDKHFSTHQEKDLKTENYVTDRREVFYGLFTNSGYNSRED